MEADITTYGAKLGTVNHAQQLANASAIRAAVADTQAGLVRIPGPLMIFGSVTVDRPLAIAGYSKLGSSVYQCDPASDSFHATVAGVEFRDFSLYGQLQDCGTIGIKLDDPVVGDGRTSPIYCSVKNVFISEYPTAVMIGRSFGYRVRDCDFTNGLEYPTVGILVNNTNSPDEGDGLIDGCLFEGVQTTHIKHVAGGGLKVHLCKFLAGHYAYYLCPDWTVGPRPQMGNDVMIINNSIEVGLLDGNAGHLAKAAVMVNYNPSNPMPGISGLQVQNNQIGCLATEGLIVVNNSSTPGTGYTCRVMVTGNQMTLMNSQAQPGRYLVRMDGGYRGRIDGNHFNQWYSGGAVKAISLTPNAYDIDIGKNSYDNFFQGKAVDNMSSRWDPADL